MRCLTPVGALEKQQPFPYPLSGVYIVAVIKPRARAMYQPGQAAPPACTFPPKGDRLVRVWLYAEIKAAAPAVGVTYLTVTVATFGS